MKKLLFLLCGFLLLLRCNGDLLPKAFAQDADVSYIVLEVGLDSALKQKNARVAFYISVADSNNFAGTNYRTVVMQSGQDTTQFSFVIGALADSIAIGALIERVEIVEFDANATRVQKRNVIDVRFNVLSTEVTNKFYAKYDFWGLERIVP